jgi:hypothetical protein
VIPGPALSAAVVGATRRQPTVGPELYRWCWFVLIQW